MSTVVSPTVHNQQTTVHPYPLPSFGEYLRHSCLPAFKAAHAIYDYLDRRKDKSRAERLRHCRSRAYFYRNVDSGEVRVGSNACSLRWCPVCANLRRNYISHAVGEWIGKQKYPKLITFTIKHTDEPLSFQVDRLYASFREVRRRKAFKVKIWGGVWFFQIKKSDTDGLWHPHLHCLVTGLYLYRKKLSRIWEQITLDSCVVDVKSVHDPQAAANDVARYVASPGCLTSLPLSDGCELVDALHGRRICGTWGSGRALSLRPAKQVERSKWQFVGSWYYVTGSRDANPNARAIINAWQDRQPLPEGIVCIDYEDFIEKELKDNWKQLTFEEVYKSERSPP